jgi:hypothetical protein
VIDVAVFESAGEFRREVIELDDHAANRGDQEVVAEHRGNRDEKTSHGGDQRSADARSHGGQVRGAGRGHTRESIHDTPNCSKQTEEWRATDGGGEENHLALESQCILAYGAFHGGLHHAHLRGGYFRRRLQPGAEGFINVRTAEQLKAKFATPCPVHGENGRAVKSRTLPEKMQRLAIGAKQIEKAITHLACSPDNADLRNHDRPGDHRADEERPQHELAGQRGVLEGIEEPAGALGENWLGEKRCRNQSAIAVVYLMPSIKGQTSMKALALFVACTISSSTGAEEPRYDVLSKTLTPFLKVFAKDQKSENRAFSLKLRIEQATDLPVELRGASAEIALQAPDKLRLRGPLLGERFTIVRDDEKVWIAPGAVARALLDAAVAGKTLPKADKKFKLGEFRLPFPEKHLKLLTALFSVKDLGLDAVDGIECRVLDVSLMPELASSIEAEGWVGRLWIRSDYTPLRLTLARKGWHLVMRFDDVQFAKELPESMWQPGADEAGDVLELTPKEYSRFLRAIGGR